MSNMIITRIKNITFDSKNWKIHQPVRAYFSHLLRAVSARSALFVEQNALFSTKNSKIACCLGGVQRYKCPKFEKMTGKNPQLPFYWTFFALFGLYRTHALIFQNKPCQFAEAVQNTTENPYCLNNQAKKSSLVSGNRPGGDFFYHSPARIIECVSEYIFLISKRKQAKNPPKKKEYKRRKDNISGKPIKETNLRPPGGDFSRHPHFRKQEHFFSFYLLILIKKLNGLQI